MKENLFEQYPIITVVDKMIADIIGCDIYRDDVDIQIEVLKKEITLSDLPIDVIINCLTNNMNLVVKMASIKLLPSKPALLGIGVSVTYAIFLIYIQEKKEDDFIAYLKQRGFANPVRYISDFKAIVN